MTQQNGKGQICLIDPHTERKTYRPGQPAFFLFFRKKHCQNCEEQLLSDIPNHDGLSSMYFDQNMITSGRWFLSVACGFSSYFTILDQNPQYKR